MKMKPWNSMQYLEMKNTQEKIFHFTTFSNSLFLTVYVEI